MNKIFTSLAALAMCASLGAQETAPKVSLYGFIRNYYAFDTRESVAGTEDFFYYLPKDENKKGDVDLNEQSSLRYAAITSRIGQVFIVVASVPKLTVRSTAPVRNQRDN